NIFCIFEISGFSALICCFECLMILFININKPIINKFIPGMRNKLKIFFSSYLTSPEKLVCIGISFGILSYNINVIMMDETVMKKGIIKNQFDTTMLSSRKEVLMMVVCLRDSAHFSLSLIFFILR